MRTVSGVSELLGISERDIFERAHRQYYGDSGEVRVCEDMVRYMKYNEIPPYVSSYIRSIGKLEA